MATQTRRAAAKRTRQPAKTTPKQQTSAQQKQQPAKPAPKPEAEEQTASRRTGTGGFGITAFTGLAEPEYEKPTKSALLIAEREAARRGKK